MVLLHGAHEHMNIRGLKWQTQEFFYSEMMAYKTCRQLGRSTVTRGDLRQFLGFSGITSFNLQFYA